MESLKIYLCGKMSGLTNEEMSTWRKFVKSKLESTADKAGYKVNVIMPCDFYNYDKGIHQSEIEVMKYDLGLLKSCDLVIANTKGLNQSIGSAIEIYEAWKRDIPVIAYDENCSYENIHPWLQNCFHRVETCVLDICDYIKDYYMIWN